MRMQEKAHTACLTTSMDDSNIAVLRAHQEKIAVVKDLHDMTKRAAEVFTKRQETATSKSPLHTPTRDPVASARERFGDADALHQDSTSLNDILSLLGENPKIIIVGKGNSGKSSLANTILKRRVFPSDATPCTARVVILHQSDRPEWYYSYTDSEGATRKGALSRDEDVASQVRNVVTSISLAERQQITKSPVHLFLTGVSLLEFVEVVDCPGTHENEHLDQVVEDYITSLHLKSCVYVIDARATLTEATRTDIALLKAQLDDPCIMFVATKVDPASDPGEFDDEISDSDNSDDDENSDNDVHIMSHDAAGTATDVTAQKNSDHLAQEYQIKVFRDLQKEGHIKESETLETCKTFHAVSAHKVQDARKSDEKTRYLTDFAKFERDVLELAAAPLATHLQRMLEQLLKVQDKYLRFNFVLESLLRNTSDEKERALNYVRKIGNEFNQKLKEAVTVTKTEALISEALEENKRKIKNEVKRFFHSLPKDSHADYQKIESEAAQYIFNRFTAILSRKFDKLTPKSPEALKSIMSRYKFESTQESSTFEPFREIVSNLVLTTYMDVCPSEQLYIHTGFRNSLRRKLLTAFQNSRGFAKAAAESCLSFVESNIHSLAVSYCERFKQEVQNRREAFDVQVKTLEKVVRKDKEATLELTYEVWSKDIDHLAKTFLKTRAMLDALMYSTPVRDATPIAPFVFECTWKTKKDDDKLYVQKEKDVISGFNATWATSIFKSRSWVDHPNVQAYSGIFLPDATEMKNMTLVEVRQTSSLERMFEKGIKTALNKRLKIASGVLKGLVYLHKNDICHANIKLGNVLISSNGEAALSDIGMLNLQRAKQQPLKRSVFFVSLLQLSGTERHAGIDIYSFGILLWYLLWGIEEQRDPADFPAVGFVTGSKFFEELASKKLCPENIDSAAGKKFNPLLRKCYNNGEIYNCHVGSLQYDFETLANA